MPDIPSVFSLPQRPSARRRPWPRHPRLFGALLLCAAQPALAEASALLRLQATLDAALAETPAAVARHSSHLERLEVTAATRLDPATVEWQSEGLDPGGGRERNAADTVRLSRAFFLPGQRRAADALEDAARLSESHLRRVGLLEVALEAGTTWLELAAATDELAVLETRAGRLERALVLHRERLRLGEVAGAEVTQLDLQRAHDQVALARARARQAALKARLETRAPAAPEPREGDLAAILAGHGPLQELQMDDGPWSRAAHSRLERARQSARLERQLAAGQPEAELEAARIPSLGDTPAFESFGFRVAVPLPFGRAVRERRAAAGARAELARGVHQLTRREIRERIEATLGRLRAAESNLRTLEPLLRELPRHERSVEERFRLGATSYLLYLDGLDRLDQLRIEAGRARLELASARLELAVLLLAPSIFPLPRGVSALEPPPAADPHPTDPGQESP